MTSDTIPNNMVVMAKVGAPHGVRGFLKLNTFTEAPGTIQTYPHLYIQLKQHWQQLAQFELKPVGESYQIRINDVQDRDQARQFTHALIGVPRAALPVIQTPDEYYWTDLEGLRVINQENVALGTVDYLFETPANDVMVIVDEQRIDEQRAGEQGVDQQRAGEQGAGEQGAGEQGAGEQGAGEQGAGEQGVDKQRYWIPFVKQHVIQVDLDKKQIIVDWDEDFV